MKVLAKIKQVSETAVSVNGTVIELGRPLTWGLMKEIIKVTTREKN